MNQKELYTAFGKNVKTRRNAIEKTQEEVSRMVGLSRASIANIERGSQKVLLHDVYRLAEVLGFRDVRELLPAGLGIQRVPSGSATAVKIAQPKGGLSSDELVQIEHILRTTNAQKKSR